MTASALAARKERLWRAAAAALFGVLLFWLASRQRFDYDEVAEFHAVWQVARGHKPYVDFDYDHSPYFWQLYAPVLRRLPERFASLVLLRKLNLIWALVAAALYLEVLARLARARVTATGALGAFALVALQVPILFTFAQFRSDQLVLALTLAALLIFDADGPPAARPRRWAVAGALLTAGLLLTPKLIVLAAAAAALSAADLRRTEARRALLGLVAGAAAAFLIMNGASLLGGVDPRPYFSGVLTAHLRALSNYGYRFGLARGVLLTAARAPLWLLIFLGGAAAWIWELRERGWRRAKLLTALMIFVLVQPLWVKYLWNQYLYTVLLFWSAPLALFFGRLERRSQAAQAAVGLLFLWGVYDALPGLLDYERDHGGLAAQCAFGDDLLALVPPGNFVSAQPPNHPVFRENSTFFFNYSVIPAGPDTELLRQASPDGAKFRFTGYLEELESRPPRLILTDPIFAGRQYLQAIDYYVRVKHPDDYAPRDVDGQRVLVRAAAP